MSVATELQNLNDDILDAYTAVQGKGGTMPANKNMVNLPTAISSISGGGGGVGITREVDANGKYGYPAQGFGFSLPSDATDVGNYALYFAFYYCTKLTSLDFSSLTTVSGNYAINSAFSQCSNLASVDLSSLTAVSGSNSFSSAFQNCSGITSLDLSSLTTVSSMFAFQSTFSGCSGIPSINLSSLTTVSGNYAFYYAFSSCTSLTSMSFSALSTLTGSNVFNNAFRSCTSLTSVSFPALTSSSFGSYTNQFNNMLYGCSGVTVHFPSAIQSTIGNWSDVTNGFGGTNTTVSFDL